MRGTAFAPTNIALAKYWGKRDLALNLPSNGSISITLDTFGSKTEVALDASLTSDQFILNGSVQTKPESLKKVSRVLDLFRERSGKDIFAIVTSENNFPTGAGLASSASGFAALTLAASKAFGLDLSASVLSGISRIGSGSSSRSFFGGFVEWSKGQLTDGTDSVATQLHPSAHWDLNAVILVTESDEKKTPSTDGMLLTQKTSPYFSEWTNYAESSLPAFRQAIASKDFTKLARLTEENCNRMHASALAASPGVIYWNQDTLAILRRTAELRNSGTPVFYTVDAGPNVVLFTTETNLDDLIAKFDRTNYRQALKTRVGDGARFL